MSIVVDDVANQQSADDKDDDDADVYDELLGLKLDDDLFLQSAVQPGISLSLHCLISSLTYH